MQLIENEKYDSDQPGIRYLPASFTLRTSLRSLIAYLLFTSAHRSCFRTWLPVKLVSVTKVVNQNIQGYRFNPSHFTAYKKIFCLSYPSFLLIYIYIWDCLRLPHTDRGLNSFVIQFYQKLIRYRYLLLKFLKILDKYHSSKKYVYIYIYGTFETKRIEIVINYIQRLSHYCIYCLLTEKFDDRFAKR